MNKFITFLFCSISSFAISQPYGNEWIDYSQPYYKFEVLQNGLYRVSFDALVNAGIPVNSLDPRNFQLFARGEELAIYIEGEDDGTFDQGDYIEFYGRKNDGYLDEFIFEPDGQVNTGYSLFSDVGVHYLTWNSSIDNLRSELFADQDFGINTSQYFFRKREHFYNSQYFLGETNYAGVTNPQYERGEGWFDEAFGNSPFPTNFTKNINTSNVYLNGPNAILETAVVGGSDDPFLDDNHDLRIQFSNVIFDTVYQDYEVAELSFNVNPNIFGANTPVTYTAANNGASDRQAIAYLKIKYPHGFVLSGDTALSMFVVENTTPGQNMSYLRVNGFDIQGSLPIAYDLDNNLKLDIWDSGGTLNIFVPNSGGEKQVYLTSEAEVIQITEIVPAGINGSTSFTDFGSLVTNPDYIIVSHESLMTEAINYGAYRDLTGYNSIVIDVEELYTQFAHGIRKNPLAIRRFCDFALDDWYTRPEYLFIIGKGLTSAGVVPQGLAPLGGPTTINKESYRNNAFLDSVCLVPSYGYPSCDMLFTAGLNGDPFVPAIPTGRLAANTPNEVAIYLEKIMEYENHPPAEWMKQVLHFSGGNDTSQQQTLFNYLTFYEDVIDSIYYGANVHHFHKTNSAPFQITQSDSITNLINNGVSIMTFFGHASGAGFDVSTDDPNSYNNDSTYPVIIANSCFAGDIHGAPGFSVSVSEPWILNDDRGAIGFVASVAQGYNSYLFQYCMALYKHIGLESYGSTIGQIMQRTIQDVWAPNNELWNHTVLETTLHGDPALVINSHEKPDLMVNEPNIYFEPQDITTEMDSFDVNIIVTNLGRATNESFLVETQRIYPQQTPDTNLFTNIMSPVYFKDTLTVTLNTDLIHGLGLNSICATVDPGWPANDTIDELEDITNNQTCPEFLIRSPDIVPVYPYKFSVMPEQGITLKASTGDAFAPLRTYDLQIDTTDLFNSPLLESTSVTQSGGVVTWQPALLQNMPDSTVYFWRTAIQPNQGQLASWKESSFQYIVDKRGWGQAHFFQFKEDDYTFIDYNRLQRQWDFINTPKSLFCATSGNLTTLEEGFAVHYKIDSEVQDVAGCGIEPFLHMAVIDANTLEPWNTETYSGLFGFFNQLGACRSRSEKYFLFPNPGYMDNMVDMLNAVPDSNYVLIYTWLPLGNGLAPWQQNWLDAFNAYGWTQFSSIPLDNPFILFAKKGDMSSAVEVLGENNEAELTFQTDLTGNYFTGRVGAPIIGPASAWGSLHWRPFPLESPTGDTITLEVTALRSNGTEQVVFEALPSTTLDVPNLFSFVNAEEFPYLQLKAINQDKQDRTPSQIRSWHVLFEGVPEAALNPNVHFNFYNDTLEEYQDLSFSVAVENISDYNMDSLLISYWIEDQNRVDHIIPYERQQPLLVDDIFIDTISYSTAGLTGLNKFWIDVNPNNDQLEQYHFNNINHHPFYVRGDNINPLLDVTFDGVHILDRDIVSAKPEIMVSLDDESQFLPLDDTAYFQVSLIYPNESDAERVYFEDGLGNTVMFFYPAELPENKARIEWPASFEQDGIYQLIVQGEDGAGNRSGDLNYRISFEVINRATITEVLNYPNPFTTSTKFVFTLTGSEVPTYFKIQIVTITGKTVKEITNDDLGAIHIGRNITQYAWDGKDEYGDQLARGVYLYRVVTKLNGQEIEKRNSGADQWIQSGFGKMYLLR